MKTLAELKEMSFIPHHDCGLCGAMVGWEVGQTHPTRISTLLAIAVAVKGITKLGEPSLNGTIPYSRKKARKPYKRHGIWRWSWKTIEIEITRTLSR